MTQATSSDLSAHLDEYRRKGYTVLKGVFSRAEVDAALAECDRLLADRALVDPNNQRTPFRMNSVDLPERIDPVTDVSPTLAAMARDERVLGPLRAIFGGPAALWKDKVIFKAPNVHGYAMHQDGSWWQMGDMPLDDMVSVAVALDPAGADNGPLELFPGYHKSLLSAPGEIRNMNADEAEAIDLAAADVMTTEPGDVIIFHALAPHRSGTNTSKSSRRQFYLTYNAARHGDRWAAFYEWDMARKVEQERRKNPAAYYR